MEEGEQELLKRYTDCVYYLASPLTCKKGFECEYRHSEIARLNPRSCWYWLAGGCLNPTCAFRHPPLDGHIETASESVLPQFNCSIPLKKTNAPCYFYSNGYCNKGECCSFVHGPDDGKLPWRSAQTASTVGAEVVDTKIFTKSDNGLTPIETTINTSETATKGSTEPQSKVKQVSQQLASFDLVEKSASPYKSVSKCEEDAFVRSKSLSPEEGFVESRSPACTDQCSEEQIDCNLEREEWCESSPELDVLVDDTSDDADYEDEPEYVAADDFDKMELNGQFFAYDNENSVDCDPAYLDASAFYEQEFPDSYDHLTGEDYSEYPRKSHTQPRIRVFDRLSLQKRNYSQMELTHGGQTVDLRDHLKRRRLVDGHSVSHLSESHSSSRLIDRSRERLIWQGSQRFYGEMTSGVKKTIIRSGSDAKISLNAFHNRRVRHSGLNQSRQYKENRVGKLWFPSSGIASQPVSEMGRSDEESSRFTGPKGHDLIRKEKKRGHETGDTFRRDRRRSRTSPEDFQGPKPLSVILKDKKKLVSVIGSYNGSN